LYCIVLAAPGLDTPVHEVVRQVSCATCDQHSHMVVGVEHMIQWCILHFYTSCLPFTLHVLTSFNTGICKQCIPNPNSNVNL